MLNGKTVKINTDKILEKHNSTKFIKFVEDNKDKVFTALLYGNYTQMYVLDEDISTPKWLFFENDLIEV